jgi:prepilin-type N-terminal cleavage/methylation domain-containing protein
MIFEFLEVPLNSSAMIKLNNKGFSLVESLVAAVLLGISLFAVINMVRKGQEHLLLTNHRNQARGTIERTLETPQFNPENYKALVTNTDPAPQDVIIDSKASLHGNLTVTVNAEQNQTGTDPLLLIPYREIVIAVTWTETSGGNGVHTETESIHKRLCNVQRE